MTDSKKDEAAAQFKKVQRADDAKRAVAGYESEGLAVRANMVRLKALRLAKEAADKASAPLATASSRKARSPKKETRPPGTLSGWLKDREDSGRRS